MDPLETGAGVALRALAGEEHAFPEATHDGRGVVMCAGGTRMLTCAWVTLAHLRRELGCSLPVELWHLGPQELGPTEAALFATLDVRCVDAFDVRRRHPARTLGGWELKPYALVHSRFAEVVLLDADSLPLVDPEQLFDEAGYTTTGARFWPDVVRMEPENSMWELCGVPYRNEAAWETGQVVVDKSRHWAPLQLVLFMNMHSEVFFRHSHGDKDTFHLAWRMLDAPVAMTRYPPKVTPSGLTQRDDGGQPLFQHRSTAKWLLHGDNVRDASFRHEARCLDHLAELRDRWSGHVATAPGQDEDDLTGERALVAHRWFALERRGWDARPIELLGGHRVGVGATGDERRWYLEGGELVFEGDHGVTSRLARDGDEWAGRWVCEPHYDVRVRPADAGAFEPAAAIVASLLDAAGDGRLLAGDVAVAISSMAAVTDLTAVIARERSRWAGVPLVLDALRSVEARIGERDPSLRPHGAAAGHRYGST